MSVLGTVFPSLSYALSTEQTLNAFERLEKYAAIKSSMDLWPTVKYWNFCSTFSGKLWGHSKQGDKNHGGYFCVENRLKKSKSRSKEMDYEVNSEIQERDGFG